MTKSVLDGIPGLGPARKARLVKEFGGVNAVRTAALEELLAPSWLPDQVGSRSTKGVRTDERVPGGDGNVRGGTFDGGRLVGDLGWFVIDNCRRADLKMAEMMALPGAEIDRVALVIGRGGGGTGRTGSDYIDDLPDMLDTLRANGNRVRVLFLDASDDVSHPALRGDPPPPPAGRPGGRRNRSP